MATPSKEKVTIMRAKKNKKLKVPKARNMVVVGLIERAGAGAGFHSKRGYSRKVKHKNKSSWED